MTEFLSKQYIATIKSEDELSIKEEIIDEFIISGQPNNVKKMDTKAPLKLKLKLGGSSTPEPVSPTGGNTVKMSDKVSYLASDEEDDIMDASLQDSSVVNDTDVAGLSLGTEDLLKERHKKSKKKKKKKDKDREKHKHKHYKDRNEFDEDGPSHKKVCHENGDEQKSLPNLLDDIQSQAVFKELLENLLQALQKKDTQSFFIHPVTDAIAPGYSSIITNPMDFSHIKKKIMDGAYPDLKVFTDDVRLICNNCMLYNKADTVYHKAAKKLLHGAEKILDVQRVAFLQNELPNITNLSTEVLGFDIKNIEVLTGEEIAKLDAWRMNDGESSQDAHSTFDAIGDNLTAEEILEQAQRASREAAEKLTLKKPSCTLGFLRQRKDGTTTLNFLSGCEGNNTKKEKPVNLGLITGKLPQGTTSLHNYRDDKRSMAKPVKPLSYGSFSSFCPSYDSTFANITKEESEMIYSTYGNETAVQYAESICDFSRDCDMAMHLVDQLLNLLTHDQHSRAKGIIEERKRAQREEQKITNLNHLNQNDSKIEQKSQAPNFDNLRSLNELGIDTSFLKTFEVLEERENTMSQKLGETSVLIETLAKEQKERLSRPLPASLNNVPLPSKTEFTIAEKLTEGLVSIARQVTPGALAPVPIVRRALGITMSPINVENKVDLMEVDNSFLGQNCNSNSAKSFIDSKTSETDTDIKLREILRN